MYGSLTPLLTEFLKPDVIAKMASVAGISDVASAQKTIWGAVPAILSGLTSLVSKPDGARQLSAAIANQPANLLENLAGMLGGPGGLTNIGNAALTSLFGNTTPGTFASALVGVGGFLGIGEKEVAVPFSSIEVVRNGNDLRFVIDATKEGLKAAPSYEESGGRVHLSPVPSTNR